MKCSIKATKNLYIQYGFKYLIEKIGAWMCDKKKRERLFKVIDLLELLLI